MSLMPNRRLNYILWIQDLLDTTGDEYRDDYDPDRSVVGLDMYFSRSSSVRHELIRAEGLGVAASIRFWAAPHDPFGSSSQPVRSSVLLYDQLVLTIYRYR